MYNAFVPFSISKYNISPNTKIVLAFVLKVSSLKPAQNLNNSQHLSNKKQGLTNTFSNKIYNYLKDLRRKTLNRTVKPAKNLC
jgi:hypothetical protein